jgi:HAD superfamily hydrolase (TIGR01549 family)
VTNHPLITFDFHNTLAHCDTWFQLEIAQLPSAVAKEIAPDIDHVALTAAYREIRQQVIASGIEKTASQGVKDAFTTLGTDPGDLRIEQAIDRLMKSALDDLAPVAGAIETIRRLHRGGFQLGVVSSAVHHDFLEWALEVFGIRDHFRFVLTSAKSGWYKSHPAIYEQALALASTEAPESLHIGDSLRWDVAMAARVGMNTGWLETPQHHPSDAQPDLVFSTLIDAAPRIETFMRTLP